MRPSTRRAWARAHRWLALVLVAPLALVVLTGALLVFRSEIFVPRAWQAAANAVPAATTDAALAAFLTDHCAAGCASVQFARESRPFHVVELEGSAEPVFWLAGRSAAEPSMPTGLWLEQQVTALHAELLLGEWGDRLMGIVGPAVVLLLAFGLISWWSIRAGWRAGDLAVRGHGRPAWLRSHVTLGAVLALPLLLLNVGSGALLAHNPTIRAWLPAYTPAAATALPALRDLRFEPRSYADALRALRGVFPRGTVTQVSAVAASGTTRVTFRLRLPGERHPNGRSNLVLDFDAGRALSGRDARLAGWPGIYDDLLYPLHSAALFGVAHALLWLALAVLLLRLVLLGTLSYFGRRR